MNTLEKIFIEWENDQTKTDYERTTLEGLSDSLKEQHEDYGYIQKQLLESYILEIRKISDQINDHYEKGEKTI